MRTSTGIEYDPLNLTIGNIDIQDIAFALSNKCRFGGHVEFYSVAQHCIMVAEMTTGNKLHALLHDASEAYLADVPWPIKYLDEFEWYRFLENTTQATIYKALGIPDSQRDHVLTKQADNRMLVTESIQFRGPTYAINGRPGSHYGEPYKIMIMPMSPRTARNAFLAAYQQYRAEARAAAPGRIASQLQG